MLYLEKCKQQPENTNFTMTMRKSLKHTLLTYSGYHDFNMDKHVSAKMNISILGNGGWKSNFYNLELKDICNFLRNNLPGMFTQLAQDSNVTVQCPLPRGYYKLKDFAVDGASINLPSGVVPMAKFKVSVLLSRRGRGLICTQTTVQTTPGDSKSNFKPGSNIMDLFKG